MSNPQQWSSFTALAALAAAAMPFTQGFEGDVTTAAIQGANFGESISIIPAMHLAANSADENQTLANGMTPAIQCLMSLLTQVQQVIVCLQYLNGFGTPDSGEEFCQGSESFSCSIASILSKAEATAWFGPAAEEYIVLNHWQNFCVDKMQQADKHIAHMMQNQSSAVNHGREGLAGTLLATANAIPIVALCIKMYWIATSQSEFSLAEAILYATTHYTVGIACAAAVTATGLLISQIIEAGHTAREVNHIKKHFYQWVVDSWNQSKPSYVAAVAERSNSSDAITPKRSELANKIPNPADQTDKYRKASDPRGFVPHNVPIHAITPSESTTRSQPAHGARPTSKPTNPLHRDPLPHQPTPKQPAMPDTAIPVHSAHRPTPTESLNAATPHR